MKDLGWNGVADFPVFSANDNLMNLANQVKAAVDNANAALTNNLGAVVVTGGTMATVQAQVYAKSLGLTGTLPIIQAVGGAIPNGLQPNVTGFFNDAVSTSQQHLARLANGGATTVTVLCDTTNSPSKYALDVLGLYQASFYPGVTLNPVSQMQNLQGAFMLIPNATFYNNCGSIAAALDAANIQTAIYPEREYKKAHAANKRAGKKVHGHDISLTYRLAAYYADSILDGTLTAATLPPFKEAVADED
jgi:hypothetical protein